MKRNRIVINFDSSQPRPRKRGRLGKVLLIVAMVLLLVAGGLGVGGYFWWRSFQKGPSYALAVMVDAVQRNDTATFNKMLDTEKISADFVTQVREKLSGSAASRLTSSQVDSASSAVSEKLKETIHNQLFDEVRDLTDVAKGKPLILIALAIPRFVEIQQENNIANGTVNIKGEQIKIKMQSADNRWQIVAVQDEKLAKLIADAVVQNIGGKGSQFSDEIRKQLDKLGK